MVILNLLRIAPSGAENYMQYLAYFGISGSRQHFADVINDPAYQEFKHLRNEAMATCCSTLAI